MNTLGSLPVPVAAAVGGVPGRQVVAVCGSASREVRGESVKDPLSGGNTAVFGGLLDVFGNDVTVLMPELPKRGSRIRD